MLKVKDTPSLKKFQVSDGMVPFFPIEYKIVEIQLGKNATLLTTCLLRILRSGPRAEEDRVRHALALEKLNSELFNEKIATGTARYQ